jgi:NAD(P)-dependent dehydrogenase (short-subunit alcohol dehydrogenase family)
MENADFAGRVAVVTGAWRGLGRAAAARLHERGASVAVNVRNRERAEAMAKEIGERAFAVPGDVAADGVPDEIARRTLERFGRIDILVNNAALPLSTRFRSTNALSLSSACTIKRFPSSRCASAIQIVRPVGINR